MIWLTSIGFLALVGVGICLASWIARLKDEIAKLIREGNQFKHKLDVQQSLTFTTKDRLDKALSQLEVLRTRHALLIDKITDGSICTASGIAGELRGML